MKKSNLFFIGIASLAISMAVFSCKKASNDPTPVDPTMANVSASTDFSDEKSLSLTNGNLGSIETDVDNALSTTAGNYRLDNAGTTWTITKNILNPDSVNSGYNRIITITYSGTSPNDSITWSGSLTTYAKGNRTKGTYKDSTIINKVGAGEQVYSGYKVTKQDSSSSNKWVFTVHSNVTTTYSDNLTSTLTSQRKRVHNLSQLGREYDSFVYTGSWSGTNHKGENIGINIISPVVVTGPGICQKSNFRRPISGKIVFSNISKGLSRTIDYGNFDCDDFASLTNTDGKVYVFRMK